MHAVCRSFALGLLVLSLTGITVSGCKQPAQAPASAPEQAKAQAVYFHVDQATVGSIKGTVKFAGPKPLAKLIDMSEDPACVAAHHGKAYDESILVGSDKGLANAFVYIAKGLEGKTFETPQQPVVIDQAGCWFHPRVLGLQTNQPLQIVNSDPMTHNIHPMAATNREWNHSQGPGDPPFTRKFTKPEVMIPVKCNIHGWMHAEIGVLDHPYFAVSATDGTFTIPNLPPGAYTLTVWHEKLGTQSEEVTVPPSGQVVVPLVLHAK